MTTSFSNSRKNASRNMSNPQQAFSEMKQNVFKSEQRFGNFVKAGYSISASSENKPSVTPNTRHQSVMHPGRQSNESHISNDFMHLHHADVSINLQNPSNLPTHYSSYMQNSQAHMIGKAPTTSNPLNLVGVLSETSNNMNLSSNSRVRPQREYQQAVRIDNQSGSLDDKSVTFYSVNKQPTMNN